MIFFVFITTLLYYKEIFSSLKLKRTYDNSFHFCIHTDKYAFITSFDMLPNFLFHSNSTVSFSFLWTNLRCANFIISNKHLRRI